MVEDCLGGVCFNPARSDFSIPCDLKKPLKVDVSPWLPLDEFTMKPTAVADEMFPEGAGTFVDAEEGGGSVGLLMDLSAVNEKAVHDGFFNDFEDLFDDEDIA